MLKFLDALITTTAEFVKGAVIVCLVFFGLVKFVQGAMGPSAGAIEALLVCLCCLGWIRLMFLKIDRPAAKTTSKPRPMSAPD